MLGAEMQEKIVRTWLITPFDGGRHARRVAKITALERDCGGGKPLETPAVR
jgi:ribose 5-phosphate isomerase B